MGFLVIRTLRYQTHMLPAITFIFILGVLTIIVNSLRCGLSITLIDQLKTGNVILGNKAAEKLAEWASVITLAEHSVALIAVSLPSLRVWWRAWAMEEKVRERRGAEVILEMNMGNTTVIEAGAGSKERSRDSDGFTPGVYSTPTSPTYHDHDKHEVHEHEQGKRHSGCVSCGGRAVEKVKELGKAATSPIHGHFKKPSWTGSTAAEQAPVVLRPPPELAKFDFDFQR